MRTYHKTGNWLYRKDVLVGSESHPFNAIRGWVVTIVAIRDGRVWLGIDPVTNTVKGVLYNNPFSVPVGWLNETTCSYVVNRSEALSRTIWWVKKEKRMRYIVTENGGQVGGIKTRCTSVASEVLRLTHEVEMIRHPKPSTFAPSKEEVGLLANRIRNGETISWSVSPYRSLGMHTWCHEQVCIGFKVLED